MSLKEFLLYLGRHPFKVVEAKRDPYRVMEEAGLPPDLQAVLMSGDIARISAAVREAVSGGSPERGGPP
jgi:hypothetical protein